MRGIGSLRGMDVCELAGGFTAFFFFGGLVLREVLAGGEGSWLEARAPRRCERGTKTSNWRPDLRARPRVVICEEEGASGSTFAFPLEEVVGFRGLAVWTSLSSSSEPHSPALPESSSWTDIMSGSVLGTDSGDEGTKSGLSARGGSNKF